MNEQQGQKSKASEAGCWQSSVVLKVLEKAERGSNSNSSTNSSTNSRHAVVVLNGREGADGLEELGDIDVLGWYGSKGGAEMAAEVERERQAKPEATCLPMRGVVVVWDEVKVRAAELALVLAGK